MVSTYGSLLSYVGMMYFLFIVWEGMVCQRGVVFTRNLCTALEWMWQQDVVPKARHHILQVPKIIVHKCGKPVPPAYKNVKKDGLFDILLRELKFLKRRLFG